MFVFLLDLTNAATFRDLSKPVGALNKERLDSLLVSLLPGTLYPTLLSTFPLLSLATERCPSLASCTAATTRLQATSFSTWSESVCHTLENKAPNTHTHTRTHRFVVYTNV